MDTSDAEIAGADSTPSVENSLAAGQLTGSDNSATPECTDNNEKEMPNIRNEDNSASEASVKTNDNDNDSETPTTPLPSASTATSTPVTGVGQASASGDEYAEFITYNEQGVAIYTDPSTKIQYEFSTDANQWLPLKTDNTASGDEATAQKDNPYENEHYRWCHETSQWILKEQSTASSATENEFYKWDAEKEEWIPKTSNLELVAEFKDGEHTYTDKDGTVFFWDVEKNAWFPKIDDDFMAVYQMNYGFIDNTSTTTVEKDEAAAVPANEQSADEKEIESTVAGGKRKPEPPSNYNTISAIV